MKGTAPSPSGGKGNASPNGPAVWNVLSSPSSVQKPRPRLPHNGSTPMLDARKASTTEESTPADPPLELYVAIRRGRVVMLTVATMAALLLLVFTFRRGVELKRFVDMDKTTKQQDSLLDNYNSYSGNIASLCGMPIGLFVSAAVQVILVRFMTQSITEAVPSWKTRLVSLAVGGLAAYLISNGFTALNVQLKPRDVDPVITAEDLSVDFNQSLPGLMTNVTHSYPETQARNPIANTILRNAVLPRVLNQQPSCESGSDSSLADVDVKFGFTSRDWQARLLREAQPVQQLRTSMTGSSRTKLLDGATSGDMPTKPSVAADLYLYGMHLLCDVFAMSLNYLDETEIAERIPLSTYDSHGVESIPGQPNSSLAQVVGLLPPDSADASDEEAKQFFLDRSTEGLRSQFDSLANASVSQINMTVSHVQISDNIVFDAITIEFEIQPLDTTDSSTNTSSDTPRNLAFSTSEACGLIPGGCLVPKPRFGNKEFQYDPPAQIQAFGVCVNSAGSEELRSPNFVGTYPQRLDCEQSSNQSMLVFSVGKRVTVDVLTVDDFASTGSNRFSTSGLNTATKVRNYFTITIGRLSWQWNDLATDFHASCDDDSSSCRGLHLPLENTLPNTTRQEIVAGADALSVSTLWPFRKSLTEGRQRLFPLALVYEPYGLASYATGDLLLPHNIQFHNWTDKTRNTYCRATIEDRVNVTLNNHLYNEHGLQPAYTAAVFFLFENAVVRDVLPLTGDATTLAFAHNVRHIAVWLSVPDQSAWLTLAGCVLLVVGLVAAMVESATLSKKESDALAKITAPHVIARVMLDEGQFPPLLLHRNIVSNEDRETQREVDQFAIDSLSLQHQQDQDRLTAVA